jgi:hypothetical protein
VLEKPILHVPGLLIVLQDGRPRLTLGGCRSRSSRITAATRRRALRAYHRRRPPRE